MRMRTRLATLGFLIALIVACAGGVTHAQTVDLRRGITCLDVNGAPVPWFSKAGVWQCAGNLPVTASVSASIAAFAPAGTNNALSVASTTARTALTGAAPNSTTLVENSGATDVFVAFGDNTVTVTAANGTRVPAGWAIAFSIGSATNIAYITASSTSTINATTGTGLPALGAAGSGGSGGSVTQGTSPWIVSGTVTANQGTANATPWLVTGTGGTFPATQSGTWTVQPGNTANTTPWLVTPVSGSAGSCTPYHLSGGTTASTNSNSMVQTAATLCDLIPISTSATLAYLKIYDTASATPTCSSATGLKHVIPIPANSTGAGFVRSLAFGEKYANGIGYCVTGGGGDTDNTNAPTGVFIEASFK